MKSPPFSDSFCTTSPNGPNAGATTAAADADGAGAADATGRTDAAATGVAGLTDALGATSGLAGSHAGKKARSNAAAEAKRRALEW